MERAVLYGDIRGTDFYTGCIESGSFVCDINIAQGDSFCIDYDGVSVVC